MVAYHELDDYPYPPEGKPKLASESHVVFFNGFDTGNFHSWDAVVPSPAP